MVFFSIASAEPFVAVNTNTWHISKTLQVGAKIRIKSIDQDPFPFCFSFSAANLLDQHLCQLNNLDCRQQPRTSGLAATHAGQKLAKNNLDVFTGGFGSLSLQYLLDHGTVPHDSCNYNYFNTRQQWAEQLNASRGVRAVWRKYHSDNPDKLAHISDFAAWARKVNPQITYNTIKQSINYKPLTRVFGGLLVTDACYNTKPVTSSLKMQRYLASNSLLAINLDHTIKALLQENKPVYVSVCLDAAHVCQDRHVVIILAESIAFNGEKPLDTKPVYWVLNTWGESWQQEYSDGWILKHNLLNNIRGELLWLDHK